MEADAVPEAPRYNIHNKNSTNKTPSSSKPKEKSQPSSNPTQNMPGNVFNITDASHFQIGHIFNIGSTKKSSKVSTGKKKVPKKAPTDNSDEPINPPLYLTVINKKCLDVVTFNDVEKIRNLIRCPWAFLAKNIKAHAEHINSLALPHSDAIREVLICWIQEHCDSALVAILIEDLWKIKEFNAVSILAETHYYN